MDGISDRALEAIQQKADQWAADLVQLDGRNTLVNFKITKTAGLDLGGCPDLQVAQLISGKAVQLHELVAGDTDAYRDACTRTRGLVRKIRGFSEEQGIDVGRLVHGRVITAPVKTGARPQVALRAPLLLYQIELQARTAAETDFTLRVNPEPEVNPVLKHCLSREYAVELDTGEIEAAISSVDQSITPNELAERVFGVIAAAAARQGVAVTFEPLVAVGICNYMKLPMVEDLAAAGSLLAQHDLIAALAGCPRDGEDPLSAQEYRAPEADSVEPAQDFLVLDADSSQHQAISTAIAGQHVVIDGPPGTGKSQTIANIIAAGVANGMRILFVAEKRAAIEAVTDRLEAVGLGNLVLDLHQSAISSRAVAAQLADSFEMASRIPEVGGETLDRELRERRAQLNAYVQAMHNRRAPWGLSAYQVRERLLTLRKTTECHSRPARLDLFTPEVRIEAAQTLEKFVRNGGLRLMTQESPWWHANIDSDVRAREVLDQLDEVTNRTLKSSREGMQWLVQQAGLPLPGDFAGWERTLVMLERIAQRVGIFGPDIFRKPLPALLVATASWGSVAGWRPRSAGAIAESC